MEEFTFSSQDQAPCCSPASTSEAAGSAVNRSEQNKRKQLSTFTRVHSLEIPDVDADGDVLMEDIQLDSQDQPNFLDLCISDEFWLGVSESTIQDERITPMTTQEHDKGLDFVDSSSTRLTPIAPAANRPPPAPQPGKPRRAKRISTKQKIGTLREEIQELTGQLQALQGKAPAASSTPVAPQRAIISPLRSQLWQSIAARQLEQRVRAERKNIKLRRMMEMQVQEARSLRRLLKRRTKLEVLKNVVGKDHHKGFSAVAARTFDQLLADVELQYSRVDELFSEKGMHDIPCPGRKRDVKNDAIDGVMFELTERCVLPFDIKMVEKAMWTALNQLELQDLHCVEGFKAVAQSNSEFSDDSRTTSIVSFFAAHPRGRFLSGVQVQKVVRKFDEDQRTILISQAVMEPKLSDGDSLVGVHAVPTLVVELRQAGKTPSGDEMTLVQSHFCVVRSDEGLPTGQSFRSPSSLEVGNAVWDETLSRIHTRVESFLVDEVCRTRRCG